MVKPRNANILFVQKSRENSVSEVLAKGMLTRKPIELPNMYKCQSKQRYGIQAFHVSALQRVTTTDHRDETVRRLAWAAISNLTIKSLVAVS